MSNEATKKKIRVKLSGTDVNAFAILGRCREKGKAGGMSETELSAFTKEAMSGDYENLLITCMKWFDVS
jgi:hypothetical protein